MPRRSAEARHTQSLPTYPLVDVFTGQTRLFPSGYGMKVSQGFLLRVCIAVMTSNAAFTQVRGVSSPTGVTFAEQPLGSIVDFLLSIPTRHQLRGVLHRLGVTSRTAFQVAAPVCGRDGPEVVAAAGDRLDVIGAPAAQVGPASRSEGFPRPISTVWWAGCGAAQSRAVRRGRPVRATTCCT